MDIYLAECALWLVVLQKGRSITSQSEINQGLAEAFEAVDFIKNNIVQAKKSSCGTYGENRKSPGCMFAIIP